MKTTRELSLVIIILGILGLGIQCVRIRTEMFHDNGQIMVVRGEQDSMGRPEGAWLFLNRDGSIKTGTTNDESTAGITGYYSAGRRIRDLTDDERASLLIEGRRLTDEHRSR